MKLTQSRIQPFGGAGFTVLELMIALSVAAILIGIAVPSFTEIIRQNRVAANTNQFLGAAAVARSEAVKRGSLVTICPANNAQNDCADNAGWSNGLLVFSDVTGGVGDVDIDGTAPDDFIIQRVTPASAQNIAITNAGANFFSYRGDGGVNLPAAAASTQFTVVPQNCTGAEGARRITVIAAGRASAQRIACP